MPEHIDPASSSVVLQFPRRRGRPRKSLPKKDTGTQELARKRRSGETAEALDLCLELGIINNLHHWCGMHLRWLHTLRYGTPGPQTIDLTYIGGTPTNPDDPHWRTEREREYSEAIACLRRAGHADLVGRVCIYNDRPLFLKAEHNKKKIPSAASAAERNSLVAGLEALCCHWRRTTGRK